MNVPQPANQSTLFAHVLNISRTMIGIRQLDPLLTYVLDEVLSLIGGETGSIVLLQENGDLDFRAGRNAQGEIITKRASMLSETIVREVVETKEPLVLNNAMQHPRFAQAPSVLHYRLRSIMCVPLTTMKGTLGAIYVENRSIHSRFTKDSLPPLAILANQAAVVIENTILYENLEKANRHLRELDTLKNEFMLLVAHELKTPLTGVKSYTQLLTMILNRPQPNNAQAQATTAKLERVVEGLNQTIQEILLVVEINSGRLTLNKVSQQWAELVTEVVASFAAVCAERRISVAVVGLADLPPLALDIDYMVVALKHVVGNAIKFTPDGGAVQINGRFSQNLHQITITDTGIGIPREEQTRIFGLFHGLRSITHHTSNKFAFRGGGLGLGLPTARGIIEAHGGSIWLESPGYDPDALPGTTCTIQFPS